MLVESDWLTASDQVSNPPAHGFQTLKRKMGPKATLGARAGDARISVDARGMESAQNTSAAPPPPWALPAATTTTNQLPLPPPPPLTFKRKRREKERKSAAGGLFSILSQMASASTQGPTQVDGGVVVIGDAYSGLSAIPPAYGVGASGAVSGASSPAPAPTGRRQRFANACASCQRSHVSCGGERPCARCLKRGEACVDAPKKDKDKPASVTAATPAAANMVEVATPPDIAMPDPFVPPPLATPAVPLSVCVTCPLKAKPVVPEAQQRVLKPLLPRPMSAPSASVCAANPAIAACARLSSTMSSAMSPALGHSPHSSSSSSPFVQFRASNEPSGIPIDGMNSDLLSNDSLLFQLHGSSDSLLQSNLNSSLDSMILDFTADLNSSSNHLHASSFSVNGSHSDLMNLARSSMQVVDVDVNVYSTNPSNRTDSNQMADGSAVLFSNQDIRFLNWLGLGTNGNHASLLDTGPPSSAATSGGGGGNPLVDSMQYSSAIMNNVFLQGPENASNQHGGEQFLSSSGGGGGVGGSNGFSGAACLGDGLAMSSCPITRPMHHQQQQQPVLKSDGKPNIVIGADSPGVFGDLDKFLESLQQSTHTDLGAGVGNRAKRKRAKLAASQMVGGFENRDDVFLDGSLAPYSNGAAGTEAAGGSGIGYGSDGQGSWMEALGIRDGGPTTLASDNLLFGDGAVGISRIKENGVLEW
ncbi:hypothetical protein HDU81_001863 [Chytriomyces hyalinus]|nr:hypothetical protein HDU81_001863 [Chytriomyces hyalinus]